MSLWPVRRQTQSGLRANNKLCGAGLHDLCPPAVRCATGCSGGALFELRSGCLHRLLPSGANRGRANLHDAAVLSGASDNDGDADCL